MASASTIASLATAGGTLVLAIATFASIRSANRSARIAERAVLAGLRPVLTTSRLQDDEQKVMFQDGHWQKLAGSGANAEVGAEAVYFTMSLRNVGHGMAVLHGWTFERGEGTAHMNELDHFHRLTRDLYIPPNDIGFMQGALRDPTAAEFKTAQAAIESRDRISIQLLYGDHEGGQRVVTRFTLIPIPEGRYLCTTSRHWNLDRDDPR